MLALCIIGIMLWPVYLGIAIGMLIKGESEPPRWWSITGIPIALATGASISGIIQLVNN